MRALTKRFGGAVLACTGAFACLLAVVPAAASATGCTPPKRAWNFVSAPKLHPARIHVCTHKSSAAAGMVFLGPFKDAQYGGSLVGQAGALMVDGNGNPVWFHRAPAGYQDSDFQTDSYGAGQQKVISFWQGIIAIPPRYTKLPAGAPVKGMYFIYDQHYHVIKRIQAQGKGWVTDFHELVLTQPTASHPQGTAIFLAAKRVSADLRKYGGAPNGAYENQEIQQIDLKTNKLVSRPWIVSKHVPLGSSKVRAPKSGVWDPYHANSISVASSSDTRLAPAGDMLLSLRNTFGAYDIKPSGAIRWKLINGKGSKYSLSKDARFFWQHDVRFLSGNQISMFDDGCCNLGVHGPVHAARGLVLSLSKGKATVARQIHHYHTAEVPTSGSFEPLGSHTFIGWGQSYYYSEYSKSNSLLYDAAMPKTDMSYRAIKSQWVGMPTTKTLKAAVRHSGSKATIYASWNGATDVAKWKVYGGSGSSSQKTPRGQASRKGFETAIRLSGQNHYFKVEALDSHGTVLGSTVIKNSG